MKKPLKIPHFSNEDKERNFWADINLADYFEPSDAASVSFPNLKRTDFSSREKSGNDPASAVRH